MAAFQNTDGFFNVFKNIAQLAQTALTQWLPGLMTGNYTQGLGNGDAANKTNVTETTGNTSVPEKPVVSEASTPPASPEATTPVDVTAPEAPKPEGKQIEIMSEEEEEKLEAERHHESFSNDGDKSEGGHPSDWTGHNENHDDRDSADTSGSDTTSQDTSNNADQDTTDADVNPDSGSGATDAAAEHTEAPAPQDNAGSESDAGNTEDGGDTAPAPAEETESDKSEATDTTESVGDWVTEDTVTATDSNGAVFEQFYAHSAADPANNYEQLFTLTGGTFKVDSAESIGQFSEKITVNDGVTTIRIEASDITMEDGTYITSYSHKIESGNGEMTDNIVVVDAAHPDGYTPDVDPIEGALSAVEDVFQKSGDVDDPNLTDGLDQTKETESAPEATDTAENTDDWVIEDLSATDSNGAVFEQVYKYQTNSPNYEQDIKYTGGGPLKIDSAESIGQFSEKITVNDGVTTIRIEASDITMEDGTYITSYSH
ncbi:MAG: hypothetical protein PHW76_01215, partial [Alphaproteobacteria bacterium]|nr:hypothetical protein [Alphaproteobacteria bacterium]